MLERIGWNRTSLLLLWELIIIQHFPECVKEHKSGQKGISLVYSGNLMVYEGFMRGL